jgi:hypothetical protein
MTAFHPAESSGLAFGNDRNGPSPALAIHQSDWPLSTDSGRSDAGGLTGQIDPRTVPTSQSKSGRANTARAVMKGYSGSEVV